MSGLAHSGFSTARTARTRFSLSLTALAVALALGAAPAGAQQTAPSAEGASAAAASTAKKAPVPAEQTAAAAANPNWKAPRLSWGDPDLQGTFTSRDMSGISMERPAQFGTRRELTPEEFQQRAGRGATGLAALVANQNNDDRLQLSALDSAETGTRTFGYTSYIIDPPDGRIPPLTEEGKKRQAGAHAGQANGPFHTMEDFSYYDRCITRGITGSILPSLYGDAMRIVQSPTEVAISYEMLHDTRIIPLDGRPPADPGVHQYMGSSVGHWEGSTLVVETTNLTDRLTIGRVAHSDDLKLTERFTRIDPDMIDYVVRVEDPQTFERPWTFRLTLTTQPGYEVLEYSCHEGNFFVANALKAEKEYQQRVAEAKAKGEPIPARPAAPERAGLEIYQPPTANDAVDINSAQ
ncbi:MAG TPA: hypothetical protein VFV10_05010 [Gammaproteobacteria bacterium]|nr:hypothetical protein [Gammaproteobacteria bacterium]